MDVRRGAALALLITVQLSTAGLAAGYSWYLRSDAYRTYCAQRLANELQLPTAIGQVVPRSWTAREFQDVLVWLPDRRALAATVDAARIATLPNHGPEAYDITLNGGRCEISARTWLRSDLRFVVESGLKPGFSPDGPQRVFFRDVDLALSREPFTAQLSHATGTVDFRARSHATVTAACREFNGFPCPPVILVGEFSPRRNGIQVDDLRVTVPTLSVRTLDLARITGVPIQSGAFEGELHYSESAARRCIRVAGQCTDLQLSELSAPFFTQPWRGDCPRIRLHELVVHDGIPERVSFDGRVSGLRLADLLAPWGIQGLDAGVEFSIQEAVLTQSGVERFIASGYCEGVDLERLTEVLGHGKMSGRGTVRIHNMLIENNTLVALEARVEASRAGDEELWISRELLASVAKQVLKFELPRLLPERIEYARLGAELRIEQEELYVFGTHGQANKSILTIRLPGGMELPLVREPATPFSLRGWFEQLRTAEQRWLQSGLVEWRSRMSQMHASTQPDGADTGGD